MADVDVDLDALAPKPKRARLGGKTYLLPGDMPMELFFEIQAFESRTDAGEDETVLLSELRDKILTLFQVHQPAMKTLPAMGVTQLLKTLGAVYGSAEGEAPAANRATRRQKTKTPSSTPPTRRARATSR
jgi:hypothetical protein